MKVQRLCALKDQLLSAAEGEMAKGVECVRTHEMGAVIDMIKDLCEAEEKLYKAHYYKEICEAMDEAEEEEELMRKLGVDGEDGMMDYRRGSHHRMGYDYWRYANGHFAPTGHGHRSGYMHPVEEDGMNPWEHMGYGLNPSHGDYMDDKSMGMGHSGRMGYPVSERGHKYAKYHQARMGYHESKDAAHKEYMDASAREYVVDIAESVKEMWKDADPSMKKEIKNKFVALTSELN